MTGRPSGRAPRASAPSAQRSEPGRGRPARRVLLVAADRARARELAAHVRGHAPTQIVPTGAAALRAIGAGGVARVVVEAQPADEAALELLAEVRARSADLPVLVVTRDFRPQLANPVLRLAGHYAHGEAIAARLAIFVGPSVPSASPYEEARARAERLASGPRITAGDRQLLLLLATGVPRGKLAEAAGITARAAERRIGRLLKVIGYPSVAALRAHFFPGGVPVIPEGDSGVVSRAK